ncbi:uncharacterized protein FFFS_05458 [Fusarium fujikuroi]|nr:uncharacterized protein FFFS_05458 [Fusarium fujikuroi]
MTSDDGNEEIKILIEDPDFAYRRHVPDDPLETELKNGTGDGSSLVEMTAPCQTPKEWLQSLTTVDFSDPSAVVNLRMDLATNNVPHFDLVTNGEPAFTVTSFPGIMTVDDVPPTKPSAFSSYVPSDHPGLLCLEFTSQSNIFAALHEGETPKPSAAGLPLPSIVLPIGELRRRYKDTAGIYSIDTEYVLVVDAVADAHPIWLIFDRYIRSHEDPVLPSIQDWIQSYGNLDLTQIRDSFQQTGMTGEIRARNVTFGDFLASWNRVTSVDEHK